MTASKKTTARDDLRKARRALGLSQVALAEALGLSRSAIQHMESGIRPIERRTVLAIRWLLDRREKTAS